MLRADNATFSSMSAVTINALESTERPLSRPLKSFVFGASKDSVSNTRMFSSATLVDNADLIAKRRTF